MLITRATIYGDVLDCTGLSVIPPSTGRSPSCPTVALHAGGSAVLVEVLGINAEADPGLAGEVSRFLAVTFGLPHRLGKCLCALVDEGDATMDRDVMQVVASVVHNQSDARIAADVRHPATIPVPVEQDVVVAKHVVDDNLAGRTVRPERRQHRTPR